MIISMGISHIPNPRLLSALTDKVRKCKIGFLSLSFFLPASVAEY